MPVLVRVQCDKDIRRGTRPLWSQVSDGVPAPGIQRADGNSEKPRIAVNELLLGYLPLVVFVAVALGLALALFVAPFLVAHTHPDPAKLWAYECGFNGFDVAPMK